MIQTKKRPSPGAPTGRNEAGIGLDGSPVGSGTLPLSGKSYYAYNAGVARVACRLGPTRVGRGLTVVQAAAQLGLAPSVWENWESGRTVPNESNLPRVLAWLDAGPQWKVRRPGEYVRV